MYNEKKTNFLGVINYRKFRLLSFEEKIKFLVDKNVFEINCCGNEIKKQPFQESNIEMILTSKKFISYTIDGKLFYIISTEVIDEIQDYLYQIFKKQKDLYINEIQKITIELRKKISKIDKKSFLIEKQKDYMIYFNQIDTLDFLEENNNYITDRNEYLESDFNDDLLFYDFDYIFYSLIYEHADKVFAYVFNKEWNEKYMILLNEIFNIYEGKMIINFCKEELEKLDISETTILKNSQNQLTSNQTLFLIDEIRNISVDKWEILSERKKAKLISKLTGYNQDNIRKNLPNLNKGISELSEQDKKDMDIIKTLLKDILG